MSGNSLRYLIAIGGIIIVVAATWLTQSKDTQPRLRTFHGSIVSVNPATRMVTVSLVHPRDGYDFTQEVAAPEDVRIFIDQQPASLADVRAGDKLEIDLLIYSRSNMRPQEARITRNASTQPTSAPKQPQPNASVAPPATAPADKKP